MRRTLALGTLAFLAYRYFKGSANKPAVASNSHRSRRPSSPRKSRSRSQSKAKA